MSEMGRDQKSEKNNNQPTKKQPTKQTKNLRSVVLHGRSRPVDSFKQPSYKPEFTNYELQTQIHTPYLFLILVLRKPKQYLAYFEGFRSS